MNVGIISLTTKPGSVRPLVGLLGNVGRGSKTISCAYWAQISSIHAGADGMCLDQSQKS
jgi:hypothetical protein